MPVRMIPMGLLVIFFSQLSTVAVGTALQEPAAVEQAAEAQALRMARAQGLLDVRVQAQRLDKRMRLAACQQALETSSNQNRASGRITVSVRCADSPGWSLYVPVRVQANVQVVTLRSSLPRGRTLATRDLELRKVAVTAVRSDYIASLPDAEGKALRRPARAGSTLYLGLLEIPAAVQRGQETELLVAAGGIEVKMQGTALASGAPGDLIKVRNNASGKTVEGVVTPEGWVRIP